MKHYTENELSSLAELLKNDGVISVPTDTVYGVCSRMVSVKAQENLRDVKHRPETKAFPVMCSDLKQVEEIAIVNDMAGKVIDKLMPGPLTVILEKKESIPDYVNGGMDTLAIRLATSDVLRKLITLAESPLFMTSANQSGQPVCKTIEEIEQNCPALDGILLGTPSFGEASTIVDCTKMEPVILRQGPITLDMLMKAIGE